MTVVRTPGRRQCAVPAREITVMTGGPQQVEHTVALTPERSPAALNTN